MDKMKPRIALVIGCGGLKCAAAIGVLQVLEAEALFPDMVVGCSGGAIFGAAIAMGFSSDRMIEALAQIWTRDTTQKLDFPSLAKIALPKQIGFDDQIGILDDRGLTNGIAKAFGAKTTFADTVIPFHCLATDFHSGEQVVLSKGNLARAVRASAGIPILFKPVECEGRLLIDGGLSDPLPVDVAIREGADAIIAVGFETPLSHSFSSPINFASQMFNILVNQLLYRKFAFYNLAYHSEIIIIVPQFESDIQLNDVDSIPFVIEQGRKETLKHLAYLRQMLASKDARDSMRSSS
jgi:NTE family protein